MGFFDKFRARPKPREEAALPPPDPNTLGLVLLDRVTGDTTQAEELVKAAFGPDALRQVDRGHPKVTSMVIAIDGITFWCSYMAFPVPKEEADIPEAAQYNILLSQEERQAFCENRSFWIIAQKDGAHSLGEKRHVCWTFSRLCAALLGLEGALGVCLNATGLLVSKKNYLFHTGNMEKMSWDDPDYFPVPLWMMLRPCLDGENRILETAGLQAFGLPELGFYAPKQPPDVIINYLYTMSSWQVTGRQLYRNAALIPLTEDLEVVCKQAGEQKLYFFGG